MDVVSTSPSCSVADDDIDPWGEDEGVGDSAPPQQSPELHREWEARHQQFHTLGYRDGITAGNNSSVQEGFNAGFKEAVVAGFNWGVARGASSAYAALPSSSKNLLVKDPEARKSLEASDMAISSISSATAMGIYHRDLGSQCRTPAGEWGSQQATPARESVQSFPVSKSQSRFLEQMPIQEEKTACQGESEDSARQCDGEGSFARSTPCAKHEVDLVSTVVGEVKPGGPIAQFPSRTDALDESSSTEHISQEAYKLVSNLITLADEKPLEDSTVSHLGSLALGVVDPSFSNSRVSGSSSLLEQYQTRVQTELELSVKLSGFQRSDC